MLACVANFFLHVMCMLCDIPAVPGSPPVDIEVTTVSPDQLMVTWDPVPEIHQNGPIIIYEILYSPNNTFNGLLAPENTLNTSNTSILLSSLEEFVAYDISVRAYTDAGPGNYSNPTTQRTLTAREFVLKLYLL